MSLQFYVHGLQQFGEEAQRLVESAARVQLTADEELHALAETIRRVYGSFVRAEAPLGKSSFTDDDGNKHPGYLRKTIKGEIRSTPGGLVVGFSSAASYTSFVLKGTPAHVIRPKNGKMLRFAVGGTTVYAREVNHPGTKPNPFQTRAYERSQPAIDAALALLGHTIAVSFRG